MQHGVPGEENFPSLASAMRFAADGTEDMTHAVKSVIAPDGRVIQDKQLHAAAFAWVMGDAQFDEWKRANGFE
jgi:hypothetical protein